MRILHIHKFFDDKGGAEQYVRRLMRMQAAEGDDVHILTTRAPDNVPSEDAAYSIHRYDFSRRQGMRADAKKALAFIWNTEARRMTERMIRDLRPDIIHLHNIYHHFSTSILEPIRRSGIPCVQTLHDLKLACPNYSMFTEGAVCERCKGGKYWNPILHHCLSSSTLPNMLAAFEMTMTKIAQSYERTVRRFICPSEFFMRKMIEFGEPASAFRVIRNPAEISPSPAPRGGGYVLYTGRLTVGKGVETLLRASVRVPTLPLRIAGTGPDEDRLRHVAKILHANHVTFLGFVAPDALCDLRRSAEAVVVPSIQYENSPLAVLDAMGDGVPVIASEIGGIPELVRDGENGFLVPPGNVDAWTRALERFFILNAEGRERLGASGRAIARERHSWEGHLSDIRAIYAEAGKPS